MQLTDSEWAMIANSLRVCATVNSETCESVPDSKHWRLQATKERELAERIETEMGV